MCVSGGWGRAREGEKRGAPSFTQLHLYLSHVCIIQSETVLGEEIIRYTEELAARVREPNTLPVSADIETAAKDKFHFHARRDGLD